MRAVPEGVKDHDVGRRHSPQPVQGLAVEGDAGLPHPGNLRRLVLESRTYGLVD